MNVLVLNRFRLFYSPYARWLGPDVRTFLITSKGGLPEDGVPDGYGDVVVIDDFDTPLVEWHALRLHREHHFDEIVAMSEFDLLRAARLRERLDIPGQRVAETLPYRDKLLMKQTLAGAGVPTADWAAVDCATDLVLAAERFGYPVIVKPRLGAGSVGVSRVDDERQLLELLDQAPELRIDGGAGLLAERYVDHQLFHIDGLVAGGAVALSWPAEMTSCLSFRYGDVLVSSMLAADDPLRQPLQRLTEAALAALPTPPLSLFHCEVFRTPGGDLLLNEIACRIGGGRIKPAIRAAFGVDIAELYVRGVAGTTAGPLPAEPSRAAGHVLFPPRAGTVTAVPGECPVPGVDQFVFSRALGDRLEQPHSSVDALAGATISGASRTDVIASSEQLIKWYADSTRIE